MAQPITHVIDNNAVGTVASSVMSSIPITFSSLSHDSHLVGSAWVISSAILTTYSTTRFLKHGEIPGNGKEGGIHTSKAPDMLQSNRSHNPFLSNNKKESLEGDCQLIENLEAAISRPALLTLYRFSGSLLLGLIVQHQPWRVTHRIKQTWLAARYFAFPALFLFIANYCNSLSLDRIGISLTYTSKCGIPLITVLLTLILDGSKAMPSVSTLLSLVPIALGIALASWNSPTFESVGFVAAIVSSTAQAALNVSSKRVMSKTNITGVDAQRAMVAVAFLITTTVSILNSFILKWKPSFTENSVDVKVDNSPQKNLSPTTSHITHTHPPAWLSILAVVAYHIEYVLSFMFVKLVEPITFGTCDAVRRLLIIISGQKMFGGEPFSTLNLLGICLALVGAMLYSIISSTAI